MRSPQQKTVVIACPHCGTRYQLPPDTLGASGRKVSCAHCGQSWLAEAQTPPPEDRLFTPGEEEVLDREFTALQQRAGLAGVPDPLQQLTSQEAPPPPEVVKSIAEIRAAIAPRAAMEPETEAPEPVSDKAARGRIEKRQRAVGAALPAARLIRAVRLASVVLLVSVLGAGYVFRTEIVRLIPDMAGVYSALGLGVNVVGLEFSDVSTVVTRRGEDSVLSVIAKIRPVEARRVVVPPVVVTLLDDRGAQVYQWSVMPAAGDVAPGEALDFTAELASLPAAATQLRLGFADSAVRTQAANTAAATPLPEHEPIQKSDH
ncbi:zinc-ribbon domain-containing protein [Devosia sp. ZB163]|uniref:zinc-ribbon domain-containing protein n=1 Tax=Devosia sp. ZB163 TaxID=3025938 RepID=UPI002361FED2|nr:zinc-ribbon domain-containing protein [Devosia sp. ZB163]MDC9826444.1 zinc-ribbon domain-containing protein [Devosia sp. ZB163]